MQLTAMKEQIEQVMPEWCAANGFGDDPVTLSTFTELAVRLLTSLPSEPSQDTCLPFLGPNLHLADECPAPARITDDSITQGLLRPFAKGELLQPAGQGLAEATTPGQRHSAEPASTAHGQSASVEWMPDCAGDWRPLLHENEWWVVGHYMMYPAKNESDAERLCQEFASQN